jgi:hypothetical protein
VFDIPIHRTHDDGRYRGRDLKFGGDFFLERTGRSMTIFLVRNTSSLLLRTSLGWP